MCDDTKCIGCMNCGAYFCGDPGSSSCDNHVHAYVKRHMEGARWSTALLFGNEQRRTQRLLCDWVYGIKWR